MKVDHQRVAILPAVLLLIALAHSWLLDPREIFTQKILMWDGKYLYDLANHVVGGAAQLPPEPFNTRFIYPVISYCLKNLLDIDYVLSTYLVDVTVVLILSYLINAELRRFSVSAKSRMVILVIFLFSWNFPLRFAGYWPASGFSTQLLCIFIVYKVLSNLIRIGRIDLKIALLSLIAVGFREIALLLFILYLIYMLTYARKEFTRLQKSNLSVLVCSCFTLYWYLGEKVSNPSSGLLLGLTEKFQIHLMTSISNLNLFKYVYASTSSLGIIFLTIATFLSIPSWRRKITSEFNKNELTKLPILFILGGHCLYLIGGADLERFLIWMFPFYSIVFGRCLDLLSLKTKPKWKFILIFVLVFQAQVLSPAFPHVFFPNPGNYCSQAGLKTNYSDSKYFGIPAMKVLRNNLEDVSQFDLVTLQGSQYLVLTKEWKSGQVAVPIPKTFCAMEKHSTFFNSYRYEINNLPIPLGFIHNQYEPYIRLASYGDQRVHAILVFQWLLLFVPLRIAISKIAPGNSSATMANSNANSAH